MATHTGPDAQHGHQARRAAPYDSAMPEPAVDFSGARLKLERASKHLGDLKALADPFIADDPFDSRYTTEPGDNGATVYRVFAVVRNQPPADEWAPIIGDAVHNLRSALDHVVWAIADEAERYDRAQYPIYSHEGAYNTNAPRLLAGVSARRSELIRGTQPFRWPRLETREWHPLNVLQRLDNDDKHRTLHTLATFSRYRWVGLANAQTTDTLLLPEHTALVDGAEVWRFEATPEDPMTPMVVEPKLEFEIGITGTFNAMLPTLASLALHIQTDVMPQLEHPDDPMYSGFPLAPM